MKKKKVIALVAHDNRKIDLKEWVEYNWRDLIPHKLVCTGTTGKIVNEALTIKCQKHDTIPPEVVRLKSGPLGGDQQLGALICEGNIDLLIFLWDPMQPQPHDVDVKALLRISAMYNMPTATNRATADFIITSPLFHQDYEPEKKDYSTYIMRNLTL